MLKHWLRLICICWLAVSACSLLRAQRDTLTLQKAIELGLENNYSIRLVKQESKIAANNVTYGNAGFLPRLDASVVQNSSRQGITAEFISGDKLENNGANSSSFTAGAQLNWTVFDGMRMFVTLEKLKELQEMGDINSRVAIENSVADIVIAYYDLVQQKRRITVLEESLELSRERIRIADEKYAVGSASKRENLLAQVDVNADRSALLVQQNLLATTKMQMNRLLGRDPAIRFEIENEIELKEKLGFQTLRQQTLEQNPSVVQARQTQQIAGLELREIKAERLPVLDLNLGYNYNRSTSEAGFLVSNQVWGLNYGFSANFNLFDGMNLNRRIQNAQVSIETSNLQYEDLQNQLEMELLQAYRNYENAFLLLDLERDNLSVSRQNLDIARQTYELGELSSIEFRETQKNHVESENRLIEALYQVKINEVELTRLSGGMVR